MTRGQQAAAAGVFVAVVIGLVALFYQTDAPEVAPEPVAAVPRAAPTVRPAPPPAPARAPRQDLAVAAPENRPSVATEPVPPEVRTEFNYAMRDAVKEARLQCVNPWLATLGDQAPAATFILDAVVTDGALTDIALRGIGEIPDEVADCARDAAWAVAWPDYEGKGEVRFQETFTTTGQEP